MVSRWVGGLVCAFSVAVACGGVEGGGSETGFWSCADDSECPSKSLCMDGVCWAAESIGAGGASDVDAGTSVGGIETRGGGSSTGGAAGAASGSGASGSTSDGGGTPTSRDRCDVPVAESIAAPTPEQSEAVELIAKACETLDRDGCLPSAYGRWYFEPDAFDVDCDSETFRRACEYAMLDEYLSESPDCHDVWVDAVTCMSAATYAEDECNSAGLGKGTFPGSYPCQEEKDRHSACQSLPSITGSRTTCAYGPGDTSPCSVVCPGEQTFHLECGGPEGVPMSCTCGVNGHPIQDFFDFLGGAYASTCEDAATRAANGTCTDRLDCCFWYNDGERDRCMCGGNVESLGYATCDEAVASVDGERVDICPQYELTLEPSYETCWPPPCPF